MGFVSLGVQTAASVQEVLTELAVVTVDFCIVALLESHVHRGSTSGEQPEKVHKKITNCNCLFFFPLWC